MIPASFEYERAATVDEAIRLLTRHGEDAKLLAGGHSLLPLMKLRLAAPAVLVDIGPLSSSLSYVRESGSDVVIGALTDTGTWRSAPFWSSTSRSWPM